MLLIWPQCVNSKRAMEVEKPSTFKTEINRSSVGILKKSSDPGLVEVSV